MQPQQNDSSQTANSKRQWLRLFVVAVIGLFAVVMVSKLDWGHYFPAPRFPSAPVSKQAVKPAPKSVIKGISGRLHLRGTPPPEKVLPIDPACAKLHPTPPTTHFYVVSGQGELADVFVYLKSGLEGQSFAVPVQPVVLNTIGCVYEPYILGLQARQILRVRNQGPLLHNVHPMPVVPGNKEVNKAQLPNEDLEFVFDQPELFIKFKCDVPSWMFAYVCVLDHPFFAVTDKAGAFALPNVPPGKYVIEAVHRKAGVLTQEITLGPDGSQTADFVFEMKAQP